MPKLATRTGPRPAKGEETRLPVRIVLSVETTEMLDTLAEKAGMSRSHIVRALIKKEFQKGNRK
jgi:hypothetical protein